MEAIAATIEAEEQRRRADALGRMSAHYTEQLDRGRNYTNLVIAAGYAAFFGLWGGFANKLSPEIILISGVIMGISLLAFVAWEILSMYVMSVSAMRMSAVIDGGITSDFEAKWEAARASNAISYARYVRFWAFQLAFTVSTGFVAGLILALAAFGRVCGLW